MEEEIITKETIERLLCGLEQRMDESVVNLGELKECLYTIDLAMIQIKHALTRLNEIIDEGFIPSWCPLLKDG